MFLHILKNSLILTKWLIRKIRVNFTYSFVIGAFVFMLFFNFMDNAGRVSVFSLDVLGSEILETPVTHASIVTITNSHNKDALMFDEANVVSASGGPSDTNYIDVNTIGNDALISNLPALTINTSQNARDGKTTYTVEQGDTVSKIAAEFGVTTSTVLWANGLSATSYIKEGQELKILPVTGVEHIVKKGDTVSTLASKYKASQDDIIAFNSLPADGSLQIGDELMIPDGEMPTIYSSARASRAPVYARSTVNASSYFIFPTHGTKTQGLHDYNAIDIGNKCGTSVYAAADGIVELARTTKSRERLGAAVFGGYGNHVRIRHSNGVVTLYAHLESVFVSTGQTVKQGQQIGLMGGGFEYVNGVLLRMRGAGKSTGCHLHFEVRGAANPMSRYWKF